MIEIERDYSQLVAGQKFAGDGSIDITGTTLVSGGVFDMSAISTYTFYIYPILISGTAPTQIDVVFNKKCRIKGIGTKDILGTPKTVAITSGIIADPLGIVLNVDDLTPDAVFNAMEITAKATDGTAVVKIRVVIVGS